MHAGVLVKGGAIGTPLQTIGMGPHKVNESERPAWFIERARYGGILCDIASHQFDQSLDFHRFDERRSSLLKSAIFTIRSTRAWKTLATS